MTQVFQLPSSGELYQHYKGNLYRILDLCMVEASGKPGVRYRAVDPQAPQLPWIREVSDFCARVVVDDVEKPRFRRVPLPGPEAMESLVPESLLSRETLAKVLNHYDEPHRHYHARWHIHAMFQLAQSLRVSLSREQTAAILFHDIVYVPGADSGTNEALSALLLRQYAPRLGDFSLKVACNIIHDTATHQASIPASNLVLDLDLAVLAQDETLFAAANEMVWLENRVLIEGEAPRRTFDTKRLEFLLRLADRGPLFSEHLAHLEEAARHNIEAARQDWIRQYGS